jgi:putative transposase
MGRERIVYPGAIYHFIHRAPGKENLFLEDKDYLRMLSLIKRFSPQYNWKIFVFCLMPNHLHLLMQIKEPNLSQGAKALFEGYTKDFNNKYQRKGPVFSKPFKAHLCQDQNYLLAASVYIHLNPLKAGLAQDLGNYRWSSINLYIEDKDFSTFVDYEFILRILNDDLGKAREIYRELLTSSVSIEYRSILRDRRAVEKFKLSFLKFLRRVSQRIGEGPSKIWDLDEEIRRFREKARARSPKDMKAKRYLIEQLISNGYSTSEIASLLNVSRQSIYKILKKSFPG